MKDEKLIKKMLKLRVEEFNCLANAFWNHEIILTGLPEMQRNIEDLCWILDIEPITKYNRL